MSCEKEAIYDSNTQTCSYPSFYEIYNKKDQYQVVSGSLVDATSHFFSRIYKSQNKELSFSMDLKNNQSYLLKFNILVPVSYVDTNTKIRISTDGLEWTVEHFDRNKATLTSINKGERKLYILSYSVNRFGQRNIGTSQVILFQTVGTAVGEEFYLVDPIMIQYQCNSNCLDCIFAPG